MYNTSPHFNVHLLTDKYQSSAKDSQTPFLAMILWISLPNYRLIWFDKHLSNHLSVNHVLRRILIKCACSCHLWYPLLIWAIHAALFSVISEDWVRNGEEVGTATACWVWSSSWFHIRFHIWQEDVIRTVNCSPSNHFSWDHWTPPFLRCF